MTYCGHCGCGGVQVALEDSRHGIIDYWLEPIREIHCREAERIEPIRSALDRVDTLCEFNVQTQITNVAKTTLLHDAWARRQEVAIHGRIYGLADGLFRDLDVAIHERKSDKAYAIDGRGHGGPCLARIAGLTCVDSE